MICAPKKKKKNGQGNGDKMPPNPKASQRRRAAFYQYEELVASAALRRGGDLNQHESDFLSLDGRPLDATASLFLFLFSFISSLALLSFSTPRPHRAELLLIFSGLKSQDSLLTPETTMADVRIIQTTELK